MRSVSIHMPSHIRESPAKGVTPRGSQAGSTPRGDSVGIGAVLSQSLEGESAVIVQHVWPGSNAEAAGVQSEDIIVSVDGTEGSASSAQTAKDSIHGAEGSTVVLTVRRGGDVLDIGPITRGNWATISNMDHSIGALQRIAVEHKIPALSEICANMTQVRRALEEERKTFQEEVARVSTKSFQAINHAQVLEGHLIEMAEGMGTLARSAATLREKDGSSEFVSKQKATARQFSRVTTEMKRKVDFVVSRFPDATGKEDSKAELKGVKSQIDGLMRLHTSASKDAFSMVETVSELHRMAASFTPVHKGAQGVLGQDNSVAGLIDGWKACTSGESSGQFWYNTHQRKVSLTSPSRIAQASKPNNLAQRVDAVICRGQELVAQRASFGVVRDITGLAIRAEPFLADAKLDNGPQLKGNIAVIGRGKCSFVSKAKRAISVGAKAVVIVNTAAQTCEVVGESAAVRVPVLSIGEQSAKCIVDGEEISLMFDLRMDEGEAAVEALRLEPAVPLRTLHPSQRKPARAEAPGVSHLATHQEGVVVARASPPSALVSVEQPGANPPASRSGLGSKHMSQSLGSASLCSQDGTVVMHGERTAPVPKRPLASLVHPDGSQAPSAAEPPPERPDARAPATPRSSLPAPGTPRGSASVTPRSSATPRGLRLAQPGPEPTAGTLRTGGREDGERRGRPGGGGVSPQVRTMDGEREGAWTASEWSIKSQGSVRGKRAQLKIRLYRMAVEAVGVLKLPAGWDMRMSRTYKQVFFYNRETGERRWSRPPCGAMPPPAAESERGGEEGGPSRAGSAERKGSPLPSGADARDEEGESALSRVSSGRAAPAGLTLGALSPPVGAVVSHGVVIPPWPEELRSAMGTMARILVAGKQIICTRAEFGMQANPAKCKGVVTGRAERAQPWLANSELHNAESMRGSVAIIGRGGCPFTDKARAVEQAGAIAAVIVNHADTLFNVLGSAPEVTIPVVSVTKSDGENLQSGMLVAVQWGDSETAADIIEDEPELSPVAGPSSWSFKMTSKVVHNGSVADEEEHPPSVC